MSILVIAAHPDDETLGCGGTIARLSSQQKDVNILILGQGITSRVRRRSDNTESELSALRNNSRDAARILGAKSVTFETFPDNRFDTVPLLSIVQAIESAISKFKPETIFTHHCGDLNIDHSITFRATLTAARPLPGSTVKKIFAFETLSATDYSLGHIKPAFLPHLFIDIESYIDQKIEAMKAYTGEIRTSPHPRSIKTIKALAELRGSMAGLNQCESFSVIRAIKDNF